MNPFDDNRKRRKDIFDDFFDDKEIEKIFAEFERMIERAMQSDIKPGKPIIYGYNMKVGPNGVPKIQEFGNIPLRRPVGKQFISEEREPITDVLESKNEVSITIEIPGVEKEDINVQSMESTVEISVDSPKRKYHKIIALPCDVYLQTAKATYKNGILDITIKRKEKKKKEGFKAIIE